MATPVDSTSQIVNAPAAESRSKAERPERVEKIRPEEPAAKTQRPDPDSSTGNNIDTTA